MSSWFAWVFATLLHAVSQPSAVELAARIDSMTTLGRVLYVAAHPDDENTQLLAWLRGELGYRAAYVSLTRGDGGQNLIGSEQAPLLGIMRTWELLSARDIDGAEQFMGTRRDFGYSKSAEETLEVWGEDETIADLVTVMRRFRPHAVITRFPEQGETHGHHLASARVARAAWALAGDASYVDPAGLDAWAPARLLHNVPTWGLAPGTVDPEWVAVDVGGYDERLGRSWGEIAAASRSRHRSQGFGWAARRGEQVEYLAVLEGSRPSGPDPLADLDVSWASVVSPRLADRIVSTLRAAADACRREGPSAAVAGLGAALEALAEVEDTPTAEWARSSVEALLLSAAGVWVDARAAAGAVTPGSGVPVDVQWLARGAVDVELIDVDADGAFELDAETAPPSGALAPGVLTTWSATLNASASAVPSTHFWLDGDATLGGDAVTPALRGAAISEPPARLRVHLRVAGIDVVASPVVRHVWVDPVYGERVRALEVLPPVTVTPRADVVMLPGGAGVLRVVVRAHRDANVSVAVDAPPGYTVVPATMPIALAAGELAELAFDVRAEAGAAPASLALRAEVDGQVWAQRLDAIDYPHIPVQSVLRRSTVRAAPLDLAGGALRVGEIEGPGDLVGERLRDVGIDVRPLEGANLDPGALDTLDAVLVGIRAFNADPRLHESLPVLLAWVEQGGVLVVQYQTNSRIGPLAGDIGPAPLVIGRGRVTDETAALRPLEPDSGVWTQPNMLSPADFEGWVQERGLYFAESWEAPWEPVVAIADPGEDEQLGAVLVARHGRGRVVYTGLSFFRQLPAGVPGGYRLLVNLLSPGPSDG